MSKNINRIGALFFYIAFVLYLLWGCFRDINVNIPYKHLTANLSVIFSCICILLRYPFTFWRILFLLVFTGTTIYLKYTHIESNFLLPLSFLIFAAYKVDLDKIVRLLFKTTLISTSIVILLSLLGIIEDKIYYHSIYGIEMETHSMGFTYYSFFAFRFMTIFFSYIYIKRDTLGFLSMAFLLFLSVQVYFLSTTRLQLISSLIFLALYLFVYKFRFISFNSKIWGLASIIVFPLFFLSYNILPLSIIVSPDLYDWWDELFQGRMTATIQGFMQYPVSLWGNEVEMSGVLQMEEGATSYFYIDCAYAYWLLVYGVFFSILTILAHTIVFYRAYREKNIIIYIWCIVIALTYFINDLFTYSYFSPIVIFLFSNFTSYHNIRWRKKLLLIK